MKNQRSSKSPLFDLLSDDFFVNEILSRVDTLKSVIRLSVTSKRFLTLCSYSPILDFEQNVPNDVGFIKFVDKFLEFRKNSNTTCEFRRLRLIMKEHLLYVPVSDFISSHLLQWFEKALHLNVQELILEFHPDTKFFYYYQMPSLMIPHYGSLKHLRVLTLDDIPVWLDQSFGKWVSTCCERLEELNLTGVFVFPSTILRIISSSLRVFTIDAHFMHLQILAPKLITLHVTWNLLYLETTTTAQHEPEDHDVSLGVSYMPNLEDFLLVHWSTTNIPLKYYSLSGGDDNDKSNFPSLKSATVTLHEIANFSLKHSLERLVLDLTHTRKLCVSDAILHEILRHGLTHLATSFDKLEKLDVEVDLHEIYRWREKAYIIMSFVKKVRSTLKTLKLFTVNNYYDPQHYYPETMRKLLVENIWRFGISKAALYLDDRKVKVQVGAGEDETLLILYIVNNSPPNMKFIFTYPRC